MKKLYAACLVLSLVLSSCLLFETKKEETAEELANRGTSDFDKGRYRLAMRTFYKLRDWYPFSKHAVLADLKIADGYYHLKLYERAVFAYRAFENMHPESEDKSYVINQIGLCHFGGVGTPDRDQSSTKKALEAFRRVVRLFPDSPYARTARENIKTCRENLAGHELAVGVFYYRSKNYRAAMERFKGILEDYPDLKTIPGQAKDYMDLSEKALGAQVPAE